MGPGSAQKGALGKDVFEPRTVPARVLGPNPDSTMGSLLVLDEEGRWFAVNQLFPAPPDEVRMQKLRMCSLMANQPLLKRFGGFRLAGWAASRGLAAAAGYLPEGKSHVQEDCWVQFPA